MVQCRNVLRPKSGKLIYAKDASEFNRPTCFSIVVCSTLVGLCYEGEDQAHKSYEGEDQALIPDD